MIVRNKGIEEVSSVLEYRSSKIYVFPKRFNLTNNDCTVSLPDEPQCRNSCRALILTSVPVNPHSDFFEVVIERKPHQHVSRDGPAAAQVELSDVIVAVNGTPVGAETSSELLHLIGGAGPTGRPGARQRSVELTIVRPVPEASVKKKKGLLGRMKSGGAKMLGLKKSKK